MDAFLILKDNYLFEIRKTKASLISNNYLNTVFFTNSLELYGAGFPPRYLWNRRRCGGG